MQPSQQVSREEVERYNRILQSEEFQQRSPIQQLTIVSSWDLPAEMKAPVVAAIRKNIARQQQIRAYNLYLRSEKFKALPPEKQLAIVESWDLTPEQKAPVVEAIKERMDTGKTVSEPPEVRPSPSRSGAFTPATDKFPEYRGEIPPPERFEYGNLTPTEQAQVRQSMVRSVIGVGAPVAFIVAPQTALIGLGIGVGVSQTAKAIQGRGLLTPEEAIEAGLTGATFSVVGAGASSVLRLTGTSLKTAAGRVALQAGLGAGAGTVYEYAETGEITGEGALKGAAFGTAFGAAGEAIRYGVPKVSRYVKGRTETKVSESYAQHYKAQEKIMFDYGESPTIWKPTTREQILMKLTGARPKAPAKGIVSASAMPSDMPVSMRGLEAEWLSFEMSAAPKTSLLTVSDIVTTPKLASVKKLPLFFGLGYGEKASYEEFKYKPPAEPVEKGLPESQLAYDYRGPLSFERYPLRMEYAPGKTVGYAWEGPYQQAPSTRVMKPLWGNIGSTPATPTTFQGRPIGVTETLKSGFVSGVPYTAPTFTSAVVRQTAHPFMWQGPSYYRIQAQAAAEEATILSYPASALGHPEKLGETLGLAAGAGLDVGQFAGAKVRQEPMQAATQLLETVQIPDTPQVPREITPLVPFFGYPQTVPLSGIPGGFKLAGAGYTEPSLSRRQKSRARKIVYPILTGEEVLFLW